MPREQMACTEIRPSEPFPLLDVCTFSIVQVDDLDPWTAPPFLCTDIAICITNRHKVFRPKFPILDGPRFACVLLKVNESFNFTLKHGLSPYMNDSFRSHFISHAFDL